MTGGWIFWEINIGGIEKMDYNYHAHTYRCSHATGSEEEYIQRAIQCGVKYMGFSDHIPLRCSDGYEAPHRVPFAEKEAYIRDVAALREKYKGQIDLKIGFETEYYAEDFERMVESAVQCGAEYLILGQHFLKNEHNGGQHVILATESEESLNQYISAVISAMRSGVITYVAHPDMCNFVGDRAVFKREMQKICELSGMLQIPLEINFLGIRDKRCYPNEVFWKIAGEVGSPVTFGFDAHNAQSAFDDESLKTAKTIVEKYNLNYIGKPTIIPINK